MDELTLAKIGALRRTPGATAALFLTDRCPVGCGHCSVMSRVDSPTITDWTLFNEVVAGICDVPSLAVVAVTGGEPFAERRGLIAAVEQLHAAGKAVVLYTSGHWAGRPIAPWVHSVLGLTSTVILSHDSFHAAALTRRPTAHCAAQAIADAGCHLVVQVLDEPNAAAWAREQFPQAEISVVKPLPTGRGAQIFHRPVPRAAEAFGPCALLNSPTIRYDGVIAACCNESVIMGAGPELLRRKVSRRGEVAAALAGLRADPVLRIVGTHGPRALTPLLPDRYRTVCHACWAVQRAAPENSPARRALAAVPR